MVVTNRVSADLSPPGGWPKLDVCQAVVKDELMCTSSTVMGTARTRLNKAGRTWETFPVNAAVKPRVLQLRCQLFQLAVLIAVDRHQALLVETHTHRSRQERVQGSAAAACHPVTEWPPWPFDLTRFLRVSLVRNKIGAEGSKTVSVDCRRRAEELDRMERAGAG